MWWQKFKDAFYHYFELNPEDEEAIEVGIGYVCQFPHIALQLMQDWTTRIDQHIARVAQQKEDYKTLATQSKLSGIRLFTYEEFLEIFHQEPQEFLYQDTQGAFRYLVICNTDTHQFFIQHYSPDEASYFRLISEFDQVPMAAFFFRPLRIPCKLDEFQKNTYITGSSGVGKSELMKSIFYRLMHKKDKSLILIDPHGDLSEDIFQLQISQNQKHRLLYIAPDFSKNKTATINPFETDDKSEANIDLLTQELVNVFKEIIPSTLSLQMEAILNPCVATLLRTEFGSLSELQRFMDDSKNQDLVALGLQSPNPSHQEFFKQAFLKSDYRITKQSIYTRIQSLLNHRIFYHLINGKSTLDLKQVMDKSKILILNLSQGKMGSEMASIYGKFIIAQLTSIALRRAYQPKFLRTPTYLFLDEFHNFLSPSIEKILSETRKYRLHIVMAHQSLAQITHKKLKDITLSNTNIKFVGKNSPSTLQTFARELGLKVEDLQNLAKFQFYTQVASQQAFIIRTTRHLLNRAYQLSSEEKQALKKFILHSGLYRTITTDASAPLNEAEASSKSDTASVSKPTNPEVKKKIPKPKFTFKKDSEDDTT